MIGVRSAPKVTSRVSFVGPDDVTTFTQSRAWFARGEVEALISLDLRLVGAVYAEESGLHEGEGVGRR